MPHDRRKVQDPASGPDPARPARVPGPDPATHSAAEAARRPPGLNAPRRAEVRAVLGFLARFAAGWVATLVLFALVPAIDRWAVSHTVWSLLLITRLFGVASSGVESNVVIAGVSVQIVPDCTPLMPTAALWIAIAAFPAPWRWKIGGLLAGAVLLWLYNMVRILALVPVLAYRPQLFDFIHVYLWQTVTLIVVFALFLSWLKLHPPRDAPA
jgi:exosortase/archaeosortase family protein